MKRFAAYFLFTLAASSALAGPLEDDVAASTSRKEAIALLRQGKLTDSQQKLGALLPGGGNTVTLGRQWVRIAFHLHARGEYALARQAANEALALATTAVLMPGVSTERSAFLLSAGLVCERVLRNPTSAKTFYDAAVVAQPNNQEAREKQRIADAKNRRRAAGKNAGS